MTSHIYRDTVWKLGKFQNECGASVAQSSETQSKRLSPLRSWVRFSLWTHVKRVSQRSAESRGFPWILRFPPTRKVDRVGYDKHNQEVISQLLLRSNITIVVKK